MNKPVLYTLILFISSIQLYGQQNLVPNGSFEEYWECPTGNDLNNGQFERCKYWWKPTLGTSDYFHQCNNGTVSVPDNFWGYQEAYHGNGYVGIVPIEWNINGQYVEHEYLRTELLSPLKPCVEYRFRMYVSLANLSTHGIGKLGAWLTVDNQFTDTWLSLSENPQVIYSGSPIIDTINWTKVEGTFIASGFEKYLTIGYFQDNVHMDTAFIQDWGFGSYAYYYVDSVSVYELGSVPQDICQFEEITFPNIITANNDGVNDFINASDYFGFIEEILIFNRWGNLVTTLNMENPVWNGDNCSEGVYFYAFGYPLGDIVKKQTGFIQLIR